MKCFIGVVYVIPLHPCEHLYIGQTERHVNHRLKEHMQKIKKKEDKCARMVATYGEIEKNCLYIKNIGKFDTLLF